MNRLAPFSFFMRFSFLLLSLLLCGCMVHQAGTKTESDGFCVAVSVEPFAFLVERVAGERVQVEVLVPPGKEPEHYQASPEKAAAVSRSRILFCTGMPFEATLLPKLQSNAANLKIVDLRQGLKLRTLELHHHDGQEDTVSSGKDSQAAPFSAHADPHIWFAPTALKAEAEAVLTALIQTDPGYETFYRKNYDTLIGEIETVRKELEEKLLPLKGQTVYVFHPSYGYFCDEFGLKQRAVEFEGKAPKTQQLAELIAEMKKEPKPPVIFVQPEFNRSPAETIAEAAGGTIAVHSALEHNVLQSMQRFVKLITDAP